MVDTPTFRSLSQPLLVAGGERVPAALIAGGALLAGIVAWFSWSLLAALASAFLATAGIAFIRAMARRDPMMFEVAQRFYGFRHDYPARARVSTKRGR